MLNLCVNVRPCCLQGPSAKILHVMYKRNRPGNAATVEGFTGHKIPKGVVQNTLEELAKSGELKVKESKNKIYWFNQVRIARAFFVISSLICSDRCAIQDLFRSKGQDLVKSQKEVEEHVSMLSSLEEEREQLQRELRHVEAHPPDEALECTVAEVAAMYDPF